MIDLKGHVIKLVRNTVGEYSSTEEPNFDEICFGLGLDVKEGLLPPGIDGMCKDRTIFINSGIQSEERKRFTQFHEVMHYLLNEDGELISKLHDLAFNQNGEHERQIEKFCNIGAAEFLMPNKAFTRLYEEKGFNIELILYAARYFKSSTIATTIQFAQVAPHSCITAICEYGSIPNQTGPSQVHLFDGKSFSAKRKLHVVYSSPSPTANYWLARHTNIPNNHLIHEAFLQTQSVEEAKSYIPFRSGKKMPCHCEALADGDRVYVLFHLSTPPRPVNPDQMTLI